jgi:acylphosphatase
MIRRTVLFSGRVQGVGFRYTACRVATGYQVSGYVRNLADGRVEAVIEGAPNEIEAFVQAIGAELQGCIRDTQSHDAPPTGEFADFDIRF